MNEATLLFGFLIFFSFISALFIKNEVLLSYSVNSLEGELVLLELALQCQRRERDRYVEMRMGLSVCSYSGQGLVSVERAIN